MAGLGDLLIMQNGITYHLSDSGSSDDRIVGPSGSTPLDVGCPDCRLHSVVMDVLFTGSISADVECPATKVWLGPNFGSSCQFAFELRNGRMMDMAA